MFGFQNWVKTRRICEAMRTEDLVACADIHRESFSPFWSAGALASMFSSPGMRGAVIRRSAARAVVEGFVLYRIVAGEAEIITIAVIEQCRKKGLGRELMVHVIRDCLTERLEKIFLEVAESNIAARKLYGSLGFKKVGERKGYYGQPAEKKQISRESVQSQDAVIMALDLGD